MSSFIRKIFSIHPGAGKQSAGPAGNNIATNHIAGQGHSASDTGQPGVLVSSNDLHNDADEEIRKSVWYSLAEMCKYM